jgi:pyridoxal phosphate enzyme (YggS family)
MSEKLLTDVAINVRETFDKIEKAAEISGRDPKKIRLMAVTKTVSPEKINMAIDSGCDLLGENKVQELLEKYESYDKRAEIHFIGRLQTNKVKYIAPFVALIHSVDSSRLAEAINKEAGKCGRVIDALLEIHVAAEDSKSGWDYQELLDYVRSGALSELKNIRIRGVMCIATNTEDEAIIRADFERLAAYHAELATMLGSQFDIISMGMSDDYPLAVECGSTMVRVGSKIFGNRNYTQKE